jgi:hypothetical protein
VFSKKSNSVKSFQIITAHFNISFAQEYFFLFKKNYEIFYKVMNKVYIQSLEGLCKKKSSAWLIHIMIVELVIQNFKISTVDQALHHWIGLTSHTFGARFKSLN